MSKIKFSPEEKNILIGKLQDYFEQELDHELGQFEADFLLDFIDREIGSFFYNRGLYDAQTLLSLKFDDLSEAIYELEKPTQFKR